MDDPLYPEHGEPYLDVLPYHLLLDWDPATTTLTGTTTLTFEVTEPRELVRLDLSATLEVSQASLDGVDISTTPDGDDLVVDTGDLAPPVRRTSWC